MRVTTEYAAWEKLREGEGWDARSVVTCVSSAWHVEYSVPYSVLQTCFFLDRWVWCGAWCAERRDGLALYYGVPPLMRACIRMGERLAIWWCGLWTCRHATFNLYNGVRSTRTWQPKQIADQADQHISDGSGVRIQAIALTLVVRPKSPCLLNTGVGIPVPHLQYSVPRRNRTVPAGPPKPPSPVGGGPEVTDTSLRAWQAWFIA